VTSDDELTRLTPGQDAGATRLDPASIRRILDGRSERLDAA